MKISRSIRCVVIAVVCAALLTGCGGKSGGANIQTHIDSARGYLQQGQFNAAIIEAKAVLQKDSTNQPATILLANIYLKLGAPRAAMEMLQGIHGSGEAYYDALAQSYLKQGKYATALELVRQHGDEFKHDLVKKELIAADANGGLQNLDLAKVGYDKVLKQDQKNVHAQLGLVRIDLATGHLEEAEGALNKILKANPNQVDTLMLLGATYFREGRVDLAENELTKAIAALPTTDRFTERRVQLIQSMIQLLAYQGRSGEALVYQQQLAKAFPNADEVKQKMIEVDKQLKHGDLKKAQATLNQIDAISPNNSTTDALRAVIAYLQGNDQLADKLFNKSVDPETASNRLLKYFAADQIRLNRPYRVVQILQARAQKSRDPKLLALYGIAAMSADQQKAGEAALRKAIDLAPKQGRLSVVLAGYLSQQDPDGALKVLTSAHAINPHDPTVAMALMIQYLNMNKTKDAERLKDAFLKSESGEEYAHLVAGTYFMRLGQLEAAAKEFVRAHKLRPNDMNPLFDLAEVQLQQKKYESAEHTYRQIIAGNGQSVRAYLGLLQTYVNRGKATQGVNVLSDIGDKSSSKASLVALAEYYANLNQMTKAEAFLQRAKGSDKADFWKRASASIYARQARQSLAHGDFKHARESVFTALAASPGNAQLLSLLAQIEIGAGDLTEAHKVVEQLKQTHPGAHVTLMRQGDLADAEGNPEQARTWYERAWRLSPSDMAGQGIYLAYLSLHDTKAANQFLGEWHKTLPDSTAATINLANTFVGQGETDKAIDAYKALLERQPDSVAALNNLAWIYLQSNRVPEAVTTSKMAYQQLPDNGHVADTYGWALYKANRLKEAESILTRAVNLTPDPRIKKHLETVRKSLAGNS